MSNANLQNRRRSQRVSLQVAVLVRTETPGGEQIQIQGFTSEVSAHGGSLELPFKLTANQKITLVNPHTGREIGCRVVTIEGSPESWFTIAFEFSERCPQFWPLSFVPKDWGAPEKVGDEIR
jgi:hypothetical protein